MAQFFSAGQHAYGVIAVGQVATGVIAIGQMATGVIAIGQVARGGIAIGMGAIGLVSIGMAALGVFYAGGMVGAAARPGFGFILPLLPLSGNPRRYPNATTLRALGPAGATGWLPVQLVLRGKGDIQFVHQGRPIEVKVTAALRKAATRFAARGGRAMAKMRGSGPGTRASPAHLTCTRLMAIARPGHHNATWWLGAVAQLAALAVVTYVTWRFVLAPLGDALWLDPGILT